MYTADEVKAAHDVRDKIIKKEIPHELQSLYAAGMIVMWEEKNKHIEKLNAELETMRNIIHGIEEGSEMWKDEYENAIFILRQMVELKSLSSEGGRWGEYSETEGKKVFENANEFLKKYQHQ